MVFALGAALCSTIVAAQTPLYSVQPLNQIPNGTGDGVSGVNAAGEAAGSANSSTTTCVSPNSCAVTWINGFPTFLAQPPGSVGSIAKSINNAGQVAGFAQLPAQGLSQAVVWSNGSPTLLPQPTGAPQGVSSVAADINDAGQVAGTSALGPTIWNGSTPTVLGFLSGFTQGGASGINASGVAVGVECCFKNSQGVYEAAAVIWHGTTPTALASPKGVSPRPYSEAFAVNKSGIVVGEAHIRPNGAGGTEAVAWANGVITALGDLDGISAAYALNDRGIIVGYSKTPTIGMRAVVWNRIGGATQDLNTLIDPTVLKQLTLQSAVGINNNCSIVVNGAYKKATSVTAFLLTLNDPSKCVNGGL